MSEVTIDRPATAMERPTFYLDKETHTYWYHGRQIPGISFLLKWHRYIDTQYYTERGRHIGTAVHAWSALFDRGTPYWDQVTTPDLVNRLRAYARFKNERGFVPDPDTIELSLYSPGGLYACTIDRTGSMPGVKRMLLEIKCGAKAPWHKIQTAMQKRCLPSEGFRRFCLYLHADGTYQLDNEHTDQDDEQIGMNLASDYNWRISNGYK